MEGKKPEIRSVDIGDSEVEYLYYGGGENVIIFLHATGFLPWLWHPIARRFNDSYTVIAPYFCDHRDADHEVGLNWMVLAEDLCLMCEKLGLKNPYLVGHSMGATVITLANATHGSIAEKMVIIEPIFLPEPVYNAGLTIDQHPLAAKAVKRKNFWDNEKTAMEYLRSKPLFKNWDDEMLDLYITYGMIPEEGGGLQLACAPKKEAALFMGSIHHNPWPLLEKISCPVLVMEGGQSENKQFIDLQKVTSMLPEGVYHQVDDAGHLIPMEQPEKTVQLIREFFES